MSRTLFKSSTTLLIAVIVAIALSGGVLASVKATSPLTVAKLVKSGEDYSIVHNSGFSFLLPSIGDISVFEAKDAYGLRKLFISSSKGPVLEISIITLDSLVPGPLDAMSMSFMNESEVIASGTVGITAAGLEGLRFTIQGKTTSTSGTAPIKLYTLLTDYKRAILIVAYAQQTSITDAENLLGSLIIGLQLDGSWSKTTV
jgi:hypothetical protein